MSRLESIIVQADGHSAELGKLVATFAIVEGELEKTLGTLFELSDWRRTRILFQTIQSFSAKLNLARRLLVVFYQDDVTRQDLLALFDRVERVNSKRNDNVHALWGAGNDWNSCVGQLMTRFPSTLPGWDTKKHDPFAKPASQVTAKDLLSAREEAERIAFDLQQFMEKRFCSLKPA